MQQQFFTSTLISKYIKYLLSYTPLPLYPIIRHNEYMVNGSIYLYKDKLLKCTKSGIFNGLSVYDKTFNYLFVNEDVKVNETPNYMTILYRNGHTVDSPLCVTDGLVYVNEDIFAKYDLINDYVFGEEVTGITQKFVSNNSYYDSLTHKFLGDYLRLLNNYFDLNLMSLYNCYNCVTVNNIKILNNVEDDNYVTDEISSTTKVLLVPIKFNTTYTIAMDCSQAMLVKAVICRNNNLVKINTSGSDTTFISNIIGDKPLQINGSSFNEPFYFTVSHRFERNNVYMNDDTKLQKVHRFCNDLYMAIQVPIDFNSTVVVLEGSYSNESHNIICDVRVTTTKDSQTLDNALPSIPSLLHINDGNQHPFSDKLISYLLQNTIDTREFINENITQIQSAINYNPDHKGMWDNKLRYLLYHRYKNIGRTDINQQDTLGYVDKDIEEAIRKGYMS